MTRWRAVYRDIGLMETPKIYEKKRRRRPTFAGHCCRSKGLVREIITQQTKHGWRRLERPCLACPKRLASLFGIVVSKREQTRYTGHTSIANYRNPLSLTIRWRGLIVGVRVRTCTCVYVIVEYVGGALGSLFTRARVCKHANETILLPLLETSHRSWQTFEQRVDTSFDLCPCNTAQSYAYVQVRRFKNHSHSWTFVDTGDAQERTVVWFLVNDVKWLMTPLDMRPQRLCVVDNCRKSTQGSNDCWIVQSTWSWVSS